VADLDFGGLGRLNGWSLNIESSAVPDHGNLVTLPLGLLSLWFFGVRHGKRIGSDGSELGAVMSFGRGLARKPPSAYSGIAQSTQTVNWLLDAGVFRQPAKNRGNRAVIQWLEREQDACYSP